jgi:hypothetical protein
LRPWEWQTPANFWRVRRYRAATGRRKSDRFIYPHVLRYGNHSEFGCHSLIPGTTLDELVKGFEEARSMGGHFCLATHHWEIDPVMAGVLRGFFEYTARVPEVRFVPADDLFG